MTDLNNKSNAIWMYSCSFKPFIVEYLGNYLDVPGDGWIATDLDGRVVFYQNPPIQGNNKWLTDGRTVPSIPTIALMQVDLNDIPWETTCHKVTRALNAVPYTEFPPEERGTLVKQRLVIYPDNPSTVSDARNKGFHP